MTLGIDFSIKSTAITAQREDEYSFYTFARKGVIKEDVKAALESCGVFVVETSEVTATGKKPTIGDRERASLEDSQLLINAILESFPDPIDRFGIEGFSFASTGNRLAQISGYQWVLRWELMKKGVNPENFQVYSPMTVKATAGKGNFGKQEMIQAFIDCDEQSLNSNGFHQALKQSPSNFQNKKGGWLKPVDDLIDSWWVLKTLKKNDC
jgi:hypothetical protein